MEELYLVMRDFLEVEYNQESLLGLLKAAEAAYSGGEEGRANLIVNSIKFYLQAVQEELRIAINRLDSYIAENENKR